MSWWWVLACMIPVVVVLVDKFLIRGIENHTDKAFGGGKNESKKE
jgi:uncharacterized membrane protein YhaH (DUF805 family)